MKGRPLRMDLAGPASSVAAAASRNRSLSGCQEYASGTSSTACCAEHRVLLAELRACQEALALFQEQARRAAGVSEDGKVDVSQEGGVPPAPPTPNHDPLLQPVRDCTTSCDTASVSTSGHTTVSSTCPSRPGWNSFSDGPREVLLADYFSRDESSLVVARLEEVAQVANAEDLFAMIYTFSELQPGENLQQHVQQLVASGRCPHPSEQDSLRWVSNCAMRTFNNEDLTAARLFWGRYWTEATGHQQHLGGRHCIITPLHQEQEWQAFLKNSLNGNYGRYVMSGIVPGLPSGSRPSVCWLIHPLPAIIIDAEGRRYWGMIRQAWHCPRELQQRWAFRDLHAKKLTLFCCTYVSGTTGAILSQNQTSMSTFGMHGQYNTETGLTRRGSPSNNLTSPSPDTCGSTYTAGANFLEMLFHAQPEELDRVRATVTTTVYRLYGLEITHDTLRAWMGVCAGTEVFHDVQIVANQDPITLEQVYAVSQIDVTDRVLAQRQLQQAHAELAVDKARMSSLMQRQYDLIACLGKVNDMGKSVGTNVTASSMINNMRRQIVQTSDSLVLACASDEPIEKLELLGEGSFGSVHKAHWNGSAVAVKSICLPISMSAGERREAMAVMEAAISSSLVHEHLVQTFTYRITPLRQQQQQLVQQAGGSGSNLGAACGTVPGSSACSRVGRVRSAPGSAPATACCGIVSPLASNDGASTAGSSATSCACSDSVITGFEVQLVLELCDRGSLRRALDAGVFRLPTGCLDYGAVLDTAMDIAQGMAHLHSLGIIQGDLKPQNVLLKSTDSNRRGFSAKVADFGLSVQMQGDAASPAHAPIMGTAPYIAPELWASRTHSPAADVYAFGITLWELFTGGTPLQGVPLMLVAQQVVSNHLRPSFPAGAPEGYVELAQRCWDSDVPSRPKFDEIVGCLQRLARQAEACGLQVPFVGPRLGGSEPGSQAAADASCSGTHSGSAGAGAGAGAGALGSGGGLTPPFLPRVDSPAERMLLLLEQLMSGEDVPMSEIMQLHRTILSLRDVRQPINLAKKLRSMNMDTDVCRSLLLLLSTPETRADPSAMGGMAGMQAALDPVTEEDVHGCDGGDSRADEEGELTGMAAAVAAAAAAVAEAGLADEEEDRDAEAASEQADAAGAHDPDAAGVAVAGASQVGLGAAPGADTASPGPGSVAAGSRGSSFTAGGSGLGPGRVSEGGAGTSGSGPLLVTSAHGPLVKRHSSRLISTSPSMHNLLQLVKQPRDAVTAVLAKTGDWQFDSFALAEASDGRPLSTLAFAIIRRCNSGPACGLIAEPQLAAILRRVEDGYNDVPYHNATHAADVVHTIFTLLTTGGVLRSTGSPDPDLLLLAAVFAAVIHDFEHRGFNNDFLVRSQDELALRYNDRSPMENHHLAAAFKLLLQPRYNFLAGMPATLCGALRKQVIDMVLATDMRQHFAMVSLFNTKFGPPAIGKSATAEPSASQGLPPAGSGAISSSSRSVSRSSSMSARGSLRNSMSAQEAPSTLTLDDDTLSLVLQMALKCADLGSLGAAPDVNRRWVNMLEEEMFLQGDKERQAGLPLSPLMDRHCPKGGVSRSQTGFFRVVALPMFEVFASVFPGAKPMLQHVQANYARWQVEGK